MGNDASVVLSGPREASKRVSAHVSIQVCACVCVHVCAFCVLKFGDIRGGREPHINVAMSNEAEYFSSRALDGFQRRGIYTYILLRI